MRKPRLLEVEWNDSHSRGGWDPPDKYAKTADEDYLCRSAGYVLTANKERIVLVQSKTRDGKSVSDSITIPRVCIKRVRRLKGGL